MLTSSLVQLKIDDLAAQLAKQKAINVRQQKTIDKLLEKKMRAAEYQAALASTAAVFAAYFQRQEDDYILYDFGNEAADHPNTIKLRKWVRNGWPRRVSKLIGGPYFERTFTDPTVDDEPASLSDISDQPKPKRRRLVRGDAVRLTETQPTGSESEDDQHYEQ